MQILAKKIVKKLIKKKIKLSFVESCTGGLLSSSITSISGSSKIFEFGLVTYSNRTKISILKVPKKIITKYGAVSKECCLSMVKKLSRMSNANISISVTGIAGPKGGTRSKPVGLVYIGIIYKHKITIKKFLFNKKLSRRKIQDLSCSKVFELIKRKISL